MGKAQLGLADEFIPTVQGKQAAIRGWNEARTRMLREFFDRDWSGAEPGARTAAWNETTRALDSAYAGLAQAKAWTDFHDERLRRRWEATQELINARRAIGQTGAAQPETIPAAIAPEVAAETAAPPVVEAAPPAAAAPAP